MWIVFSYIWLPFMILPGLRGARADPPLVHRGVARPRRERRPHAPQRHPAARAARRRRRLDLHVLADARRLHHAGARRRRVVAVHRQRRLRLRQPGVATCRSPPRSPSSRSSSWASTSSTRAGSARSRRSSMESRGTRIALWVWVGLVLLVPLHPDRRHLPVRVRQVQRAELADRRPDHEVVRARDPQRRHAAGAVAFARGGRARDADRARARHARVVRRAPLPVLRPRGDLVPARAADRTARDHHRDGAQLVLHVLEAELRAADDRDRPRDVLRRRRLQQRDRTASPRAGIADRGVDGPRRGRLADVPLRHVPDHLDRARSPAGCSRSRCRSTK